MGSKEQEIINNLPLKSWRMSNLYYIQNKQGKRVLFKPNLAQQKFYDNIWLLNIILKARQRGFTTFIDLYILDEILFNNGMEAGIIAHTKPDAEKIFRRKIQYPYSQLPEVLRDTIGIVGSSKSHIEFTNGSTIHVSVSMRSGTLQYLHLSEFGKVCAKNPEKAREIVTGSLETVAAGEMVFIESTAEGREGYFHDYCSEAEKLAISGRELTNLDYRFHFFPWWEAEEYRLNPELVPIPAEFQLYFDKFENEYGVKLDRSQRAWYVKKALILKDDMKREYPGSSKEAFEAAVVGAYYETEMAKMRKEGRITNVPFERELPVNTFWDLGMDDSTSIWFHQRVGLENRLIDYYEMNGEGMAHYARVLADRGYIYGTHIMPHDAKVRGLNTGKSRKETAESLNISPIDLSPRPTGNDELLDQIEAVRNFLSTCWIDEENCSVGIKCLDSYKKEWNDKLGAFRRTPLHNWACHGADSLRTGAVGYYYPGAMIADNNEPDWIDCDDA